LAQLISHTERRGGGREKGAGKHPILVFNGVERKREGKGESEKFPTIPTVKKKGSRWAIVFFYVFSYLPASYNDGA